LQQRIERILLGRRKYTRLQVAELAGIDPDAAHAIWLALGFPEVGDDDVVFTDRDVAAMRTADELMNDGVIDEALRTSVTRMLGQSMSRVAEWETDRIMQVIAEQADTLTTEKQIADFVRRVLPRIESIQGLVWRRHLAAHSDRVLSSADDAQSRPQAVGFVDISGYTSLSRRIGETELAGVLERFEAAAAETVARCHGRIIKSLGDEVLYTNDDPVAAVEIALSLVEAGGADDVFPALHAGVASGPVLWRFGDVYGSTVNIASRLTSLARAGTVLIDLNLAAELADDDAYVVRRIRPANVRGFVSLQPSTVRRSTKSGKIRS
jgi:adenylate cyclase